MLMDAGCWLAPRHADAANWPWLQLAAQCRQRLLAAPVRCALGAVLRAKCYVAFAGAAARRVLLNTSVSNSAAAQARGLRLLLDVAVTHAVALVAVSAAAAVHARCCMSVGSACCCWCCCCSWCSSRCCCCLLLLCMFLCRMLLGATYHQQ